MTIGSASFKRRQLLFGDCRFGWTSGLNGAVNDVADLLQARRRNDNGISSSTHVLRHLQEPPPRVLPEVKGKKLPLDLNLLAEQLIVHGLPPR